MKELGRRSASAVLWGASGSFVRVSLQFATQIALARILGPDQYGLFAIGVIVVNFGDFFADIGLAFGLVQKKHVSDVDVRFVLTWQIMVGFALAMTIAAMSGELAELLGDPRAEEVIFALAWICLLDALIAPSLNLLKRQLDFRRIQLSQLAGYVVGYIGVGLPMALTGWQVWSLVGAWLTQTLVVLGFLYQGTKHPLKPLLWYADAAQQFRYSAVVLATNINNWVINNIDRVAVSHSFGSRDIGLYSISYNVLSTPTANLLAIFQPVFFSASSRIQGEDARIFSAYRALVSAIALFVMPVFVSVAVVAHTFVLALYGPEWQRAAELLQPIALGMPFYLAWGLTTPLLWASGKPEREFISQFPIAILWGIAVWSAVQISVLAVAWAALGLFLVRAFATIAFAAKTINLSVRDLWRAVQGGVAISMACATFVWLADTAGRSVVATPQIWLGIDMLAGALALIALIYYFPSAVSSELRTRITQVSGRLPAFLGRVVLAVLNRTKCNLRDG
jgi:O-antigen/teichoic acid export membrane protein